MDKRLNKLNISFPDGWKDISNENPDGPPTFINENINETGVLQISTTDFIGGKLPNPNLADLIELSKKAGIKNEFGELEYEESGNCEYGIYGYAQFSRTDFPYISIWHLSDGKNFIFSTFICGSFPEQDHIDEVKGILKSIKRKTFLGSLFK
jgi:hypothetical protein